MRVNPREVGGDLVQHLVALTSGGTEYSFESAGNVTLPLDGINHGFELMHSE